MPRPLRGVFFPSGRRISIIDGIKSHGFLPTKNTTPQRPQPLDAGFMEAETNYTLDSPEEGGKNLQSFVGLKWAKWTMAKRLNSMPFQKADTANKWK